MSLEDLNAAMIVEFQRIGSREPIDNVMQTQFGVTGVTTLPAEQYQPLLDAVRAIPA
ncbi:MAG: hypothetical protein GY926_20225 [bacterium]|nr:hypothetical protein [bacterium]